MGIKELTNAVKETAPGVLSGTINKATKVTDAAKVAANKASNAAKTIENKIKEEKQRQAEADASLMRVGDEGTKWLYVQIDSDIKQIGHSTYKIKHTIGFYNEEGQLEFQVKTKQNKKQNLNFCDSKGKCIGKTIVKGSLVNPIIEVFLNGEYKGELEKTAIGDKSGIFMMGDLRIRYRYGKMEITNADGALIANEDMRGMRKHIIFNEDDDAAFIAMLCVCAFVMNFAHGSDR